MKNTISIIGSIIFLVFWPLSTIYFLLTGFLFLAAGDSERATHSFGWLSTAIVIYIIFYIWSAKELKLR